jgi:hypothetical protein
MWADGCLFYYDKWGQLSPALLAGVDEENGNGETFENYIELPTYSGKFGCLAPTTALALKWLRDVKNIACSIDLYQHYYRGMYYYDGEHYVVSITLYLSYEQAESVLLDAMLDILENGNNNNCNYTTKFIKL